MSDAPTPDPSGPDVPSPVPPPPSGPLGKRAFTLDLSSPDAAPRSRRPKGFVPVVQQTINLTTKPTPAPDAPGGPEANPRSLRRTGPRPDVPASEGPNEPSRSEAPRKEAPRGGNPRGGRPDHARGDSRRTDGPRSNGPRSDGGRRTDGRRDDGHRPDGPRDGGDRPSSGTSLADLLDEATLARLRGGA
jgi:hypothetical protein